MDSKKYGWIIILVGIIVGIIGFNKTQSTFLERAIGEVDSFITSIDTKYKSNQNELFSRKFSRGKIYFFMSAALLATGILIVTHKSWEGKFVIKKEKNHVINSKNTTLAQKIKFSSASTYVIFSIFTLFSSDMTSIMSYTIGPLCLIIILASIPLSFFEDTSMLSIILYSTASMGTILFILKKINIYGYINGITIEGLATSTYIILIFISALLLIILKKKLMTASGLIIMAMPLVLSASVYYLQKDTMIHEIPMVDEVTRKTLVTLSYISDSFIFNIIAGVFIAIDGITAKKLIEFFKIEHTKKNRS